MFDFMNMANSPQAREMFFKMMSRQMGQAPPEVREAISRVEIVIKRSERGFELHLGRSDNARVEGMLKESTDSWIEMLSRGFQAVGYKVKIYEYRAGASPPDSFPGNVEDVLRDSQCSSSAGGAVSNPEKSARRNT